MKVKELRVALQDLEALFDVGGTKAVKSDLSHLQKLLEHSDETELEVFLAQLAKDVKIASGTKIKKQKPILINESIVTYYSNEINKSQNDEGKFLSILNELNSDNRVKKAELSKIAEHFGDSSAKTVTKLIQSIKTRYYERLYEIDTSAMAKRATPW